MAAHNTSASAADYNVLSGTSITIAGTNPSRYKAEFYVTGGTAVWLAYGTTATSTVNTIPVASNVLPYTEQFWTGPINAAVASGASSSIRVREVS